MRNENAGQSSRKRRPTAADRDIVDALAKLCPGTYRVMVRNERDSMLFLGLARLKVEGSLHLDIGDTYIAFIPHVAAQAA